MCATSLWKSYRVLGARHGLLLMGLRSPFLRKLEREIDGGGEKDVWRVSEFGFENVVAKKKFEGLKRRTPNKRARDQI